MTEPVIKIFSTLDQLTEYFLSGISEQLLRKPAHRYYSIALSGGSTPRAIFNLIAENYKDKIDWSKILIFWGDERCVPPTDIESNYRMADETLFKKISLPAKNIYRIKGENDPATEANNYSEIIYKLIPLVNNIPQFDLFLLGLGEDGHTASIFPYNIQLFNSDKIFEISEHPVTKQKRITATGKLINNAKQISFIATGSGKADKVAQILQKKQGYLKLPASLVNPNNGQIIWMLDKAAGANMLMG